MTDKTSFEMLQAYVYMYLDIRHRCQFGVEEVLQPRHIPSVVPRSLLAVKVVPLRSAVSFSCLAWAGCG